MNSSEFYFAGKDRYSGPYHLRSFVKYDPIMFQFQNLSFCVSLSRPPKIYGRGYGDHRPQDFTGYGKNRKGEYYFIFLIMDIDCFKVSWVKITERIQNVHIVLTSTERVLNEAEPIDANKMYVVIML